MNDCLSIIVVPCYNESQRLNGDAFIAFAEEHEKISFLFVNDGSIDNTLDILKNLSKQSSRIQYLDLNCNCGKAEAVRRGMLHASANFKAEFIGFWDADLATPLLEIPHFIEIATTQSYNVVTGLRLLRLGANVQRKKIRHYLGRCFATTASFILDLPVYDTQCGAKLYRSSVVPALFSEKFVTRWLFDVEILARYIVIYGRDIAIKSIYEYPILTWVDVGDSKLKFFDFFKAPIEMIKIRHKYFIKNYK
ncbi:MAG: glycosyltransferase [Bacteroidales bacterium]|nr:glycosyltransferase [Bacteroidales bacterium]